MEEKDIIQFMGQISLKDEHFIDKDAVWGRIAEKAKVRRRKPVIRVYWRIAISVAAAACFLFIGIWSMVDVSSDAGTLRHIFPDGSAVELAANSSVSYNRIGWLFGRHVNLIGDASFEVVKDKGIFSVDTDLGTITVVGTHFQVTQGGDGLHVSCTEGSVEVSTKVGKKIINKGEQADYSGGELVVTPILPGFLEFDNTPLSDVISRIEEIYGLTVADKQMCEGRLFSGWVPTGNVEEALEVIMRSCDIDYHLDGSALIINQ